MKTKEIVKEEQLPEEDVGSRNEINPSQETLDNLGSFLLNRFQKLKGLTERSQWENDKAAAFNAYHMVPRPRSLPFEGAANLPCPLPRIGVDSFHANVMSSLFANGTGMRVKPLIIQREFSRKAEKASLYMNYVMNFEANTYEVTDDADRKSQMFGIGYIEPMYVKEERWETSDIIEKTQEPVVDELGNVTIKEKSSKKRVKKKRIVFDGVKFESIPVESIYFSPFYRTLEEAHKSDVVFKRCDKPFKTLKDRSTKSKEAPAIYKRSQVEKIAVSLFNQMKKEYTALSQARADYDGFYFDLVPVEEMVALAEAYLWFDVDGDEIKESVKVTFDTKTGTVIRTVLSPMRIVEFVPRPIDERLIGEGIPKICVPLSDEWENFHNTRSNAGQWEHGFFGFYRAGGRFNPQQYTIKPNHFYPVDDPREVSFPQTQRVSSSYFQEEQMILNYFERIFALSENIQGVASKGGTTATENMNLNQRSSIRFMNPFNRIVTQMNKLINHAWDLSCECAPGEKEFYVVGTDGVPIFDKMTRDDYSSRFQFEIVVSNVFDAQQTRDTALLAYRLFLVNPFVQQHPELMWEISQKTLDALDLDIDIPKPDQAKVHSAYEALDLIKNGEMLEPEVGIDYDHHMKVFMNEFESEEVRDLDGEVLKNLILYVDKLKILKATLEAANLNRSGMFPQGQMGQPGLTVSRNPGQRMNTTRVSESGKSMNQNLKNGQQGMGNEGNLNQILGQI